MKNWIKNICIYVSLTFLFPIYPGADNTVSGQAQLQLNFAESLYNEGSYSQALIILSDFRDLYPEDKGRFKAIFLQARIHEIKQEFNEAADLYGQLYLESETEDSGLNWLYQQASLLSRTGNEALAVEKMKKIILLSPYSPAGAKAEIWLQMSDYEKK